MWRETNDKYTLTTSIWVLRDDVMLQWVFIAQTQYPEHVVIEPSLPMYTSPNLPLHNGTCGAQVGTLVRPPRHQCPTPMGCTTTPPPPTNQPTPM